MHYIDIFCYLRYLRYELHFVMRSSERSMMITFSRPDASRRRGGQFRVQRLRPRHDGRPLLRPLVRLEVRAPHQVLDGQYGGCRSWPVFRCHRSGMLCSRIRRSTKGIVFFLKKKMGHPSLFFVNFGLFQTNIKQFLKLINAKNIHPV